MDKLYSTMQARLVTKDMELCMQPPLHTRRLRLQGLSSLATQRWCSSICLPRTGTVSFMDQTTACDQDKAQQTAVYSSER